MKDPQTPGQQYLASKRPAIHRRPNRRPAYEAAKDSGLFVSDVLAAAPPRSMVIEHRGPAALILLPLDGKPELLANPDMTTAEVEVLDTFLATDWRARLLMDALEDIERMDGE